MSTIKVDRSYSPRTTHKRKCSRSGRAQRWLRPARAFALSL